MGPADFMWLVEILSLLFLEQGEIFMIGTWIEKKKWWKYFFMGLHLMFSVLNFL